MECYFDNALVANFSNFQDLYETNKNINAAYFAAPFDSM